MINEEIRKYRFVLLVICVLMCAGVCITEAASRRYSDDLYVFGAGVKEERVSRDGAVPASAEPETVSETVPTVPDESKVCINTASAQELCEKLPGIGAKKAEAIVEYRELVGGFDSVDELIEVNGIGEKLLEGIRPYCVL